VKDLIAQIDEYRARVREIELEIEEMKKEENSRKPSGKVEKVRPRPIPEPASDLA